MNEIWTERREMRDDFYEYDGEKVQAHYSSLTLHRKCPEAWLYRYGLKIRQAPTGDPATFMHAGSWWGALLNAYAYERGRRMGSLLDIARPFKAVDTMGDGRNAPRFDPATVTRKEILLAMKEWWISLPETHRETWMEKIGKEPLAHMVYTFEQWHERWGDRIKTERPLGVEVFWKRELPRPEHDAQWDGGALAELPKMFLLGYIDELYEDTERGMIVVRDNKFNSNIGINTVVDDMMDSQLELYAWGVGPILEKAGLSQVRAVAYDRAKSVAPKPPTLTTAGKLATREGVPSISGSDLRTYLEWAGGPDGNGRPWRGAAYPRNAAEKADPSLPTRYKEGGVYQPEQSIIERLTPPRGGNDQWFTRKLIPLNGHVVRAHLRAAVDSATDIWRTQKRAEITGEAARNLTKSGCQWCDYKELCQARMRGGPLGVYDLAEFRLVSSQGTVLAEGKVVA